MNEETIKLLEETVNALSKIEHLVLVDPPNSFTWIEVAQIIVEHKKKVRAELSKLSAKSWFAGLPV